MKSAFVVRKLQCSSTLSASLYISISTLSFVLSESETCDIEDDGGVIDRILSIVNWILNDV